MNQCADSWKKNLQLNRAKALIDRQGWLLSHTMRCGMAKNRIEPAPEGVDERFSLDVSRTFNEIRESCAASRAGRKMQASREQIESDGAEGRLQSRQERCLESSQYRRQYHPANTAAMGRRLRAAPPSVLRNREARTA
jgi:hypothetical protein